MTVSPLQSIIIDMSEHHKKGFVANPKVVLREEFDNSAILFDPETGNTFGINPIGVIVWKHLNGLNNLADIADIVCERADAVHSDVMSDIEAFMQNAVDLGLASYKVK